MKTIGVLALQGAFARHALALERLGLRASWVRTPSELGALDGLILPGGESTVQLDLLMRGGFSEPLCAFFATGRPVLATCAGLILLAREVRNPTQASLGGLDVVVTRNAYGRQLDSFETVDDRYGLPLVFIRAPRIVSIGPAVEVLACHAGKAVLIRQRNLTAASFHPELTEDLRIHASVFGDGVQLDGSSRCAASGAEPSRVRLRSRL